jgi:hypothetical protein
VRPCVQCPLPQNKVRQNIFVLGMIEAIKHIIGGRFIRGHHRKIHVIVKMERKNSPRYFLNDRTKFQKESSE